MNKIALNKFLLEFTYLACTLMSEEIWCKRCARTIQANWLFKLISCSNENVKSKRNLNLWFSLRTALEKRDLLKMWSITLFSFYSFTFLIDNFKEISILHNLKWQRICWNMFIKLILFHTIFFQILCTYFHSVWTQLWEAISLIGWFLVRNSFIAKIHFIIKHYNKRDFLY